jgi:WhiB family redox-sensing transcriptional regulator
MAARGMNAGQVGRALGVLRTTVTHWRGGHRTPSRDNAARVAELVGVPVAELWPTLADPDPQAGRRERIDRVAAAAGVTPQTVRAWLSGRHQPGPLARAALAANGFTPAFQPAGKPSRRNAGSHARPLTVRKVLALPTQHDPKWQKRALCAASPDPDLWWPEDEDGPGTQARKVCARCPVIAACRDAFLADPWPDRHCVIAGVWGTSLITEARRQHRRERQQQRQRERAA